MPQGVLYGRKPARIEDRRLAEGMACCDAELFASMAANRALALYKWSQRGGGDCEQQSPFSLLSIALEDCEVALAHGYGNVLCT